MVWLIPKLYSIISASTISPDDGADLPNERAQFEPYDWLEGQPIDLQEFFAEHSIAAELLSGSADNAPTPYLGSTLASRVNGLGSDRAFIALEAIAYEHSVDVQLVSTLKRFCDISVNKWDVRLSNGASLPSWVSLDDETLHIQRPIDQEVLSLRIRAVLDNGRTVTVPVDIDLTTGQMSERGQLSSSLSSFNDQLQMAGGEEALEHSALVSALADA